jgi:hypothetical protein
MMDVLKWDMAIRNIVGAVAAAAAAANAVISCSGCGVVVVCLIAQPIVVADASYANRYEIGVPGDC